MELLLEDLVKILLAVAAGGLVGLEREFRDKDAGFRTLIFICVGAALFTMFSLKLAGPDNEPTRIAANIVSGVGFLGAGVILREGVRIKGLTTASTIWLTAALGMGIGGGQFALIGAAVAIILVVLWVFPRFEHWVDNLREERTYDVLCLAEQAKFGELEKCFKEHGLKIRSHRLGRDGDLMSCTWVASGSPQAHDAMMEVLFEDPQVREFKF